MKLTKVAKRYCEVLKAKKAQTIPVEVEGSGDPTVRKSRDSFFQLNELILAVDSVFVKLPTKNEPQYPNPVFTGEQKDVENITWIIKQLVTLLDPLSVKIAQHGLSLAEAQNIKEYVKEFARELKKATSPNPQNFGAVAEIIRTAEAYEPAQIYQEMTTKEVDVPGIHAPF